MGEKEGKAGAACSCASATLPASLQSWPALVLPISIELHFNPPADTICHTHGLDLVCDLGHFKNIVHWVLITVSEET